MVIPDAERRRDPRAVVIAAAAAAATARRGGDDYSAALEALADLAADHDERRGGHGPRDGRRGNDKRRGGRSRSPLHTRGRSSRSPLQLERAARPSGCGRRTRSRRRSSCALVSTTTPRPSNQSAEQIDGNNNLLQLILNQLVDMTILLHTQVASQCRDIAKLLHDDAHHGAADAAAAQLTQLTQFAQQHEAQLNSGATARGADDAAAAASADADYKMVRLWFVKVDCSCGGGIRRHPCAAQQLTQAELDDASERYGHHQWFCCHPFLN